MARSRSGGEIANFIENFGLGIILAGSYTFSFGFSAFTEPADWDARLMLALTLVLVTNVLRRPRPHAIDRRWWVCAVSAVSTCYIVAFDITLANTHEPGAFAASAAWTMLFIRLAAELCLLWLGTSFAILPALREVRVGFLYRYVRHPVYAIYMVLDLLLIGLAPSVRNLVVATVGAGTFFIRAELEERVLSSHSAYQTYRQQTRWRFLPGVY